MVLDEAPAKNSGFRSEVGIGIGVTKTSGRGSKSRLRQTHTWELRELLGRNVQYCRGDQKVIREFEVEKLHSLSSQAFENVLLLLQRLPKSRAEFLVLAPSLNVRIDCNSDCFRHRNLIDLSNGF